MRLAAAVPGRDGPIVAVTQRLATSHALLAPHDTLIYVAHRHSQRLRLIFLRAQVLR